MIDYNSEKLSGKLAKASKVVMLLYIVLAFAIISSFGYLSKSNVLEISLDTTSMQEVDTIAGNYNGTLVITAPVNIGVVDITVQLTSTEGASTGYVLDATTSHFADNPLVNASITGSTDGITPTFTIHSQPFVEVIAAQGSTQSISVTRSFIIEGEVLNNGSVLSGTYVETVAGYTQDPFQISGAILLSKPALSQVSSVMLAIPKEILVGGETIDITATVLDQDGQPLAGELVTFFGALGTLNPDNGVTNAQGQVTVQYIAGVYSGRALLQALAGSANGSSAAQINGSDPTMTPTPTPMPGATPTPTPTVPVTGGDQTIYLPLINR